MERQARDREGVGGAGCPIGPGTRLADPTSTAERLITSVEPEECAASSRDPPFPDSSSSPKVHCNLVVVCVRVDRFELDAWR
jgi:hypothetical protein